MRKFVMAAFAAACVTAFAGPATAFDGDHMRSFRSDAELKRYLKRVAKEQVQYAPPLPAPVSEPPPPTEPASPVQASTAVASADAAAAAPSAVVVTGTAAAPNSITNNQTANVDEGGIVKNFGDKLVVLRRGRLFTLATSDDDIKLIDQVDAFPPLDRDGGGAWYDEMLISGNMVVVIGFNYARGGTEINRFSIAADGKLTYRDTHHLRSDDYYSSRNYASRLIGNRLVVYAPLSFYADDVESDDPDDDWRGQLPALRRWSKNGPSAGYERVLFARNTYVPEMLRRARSANLSTMHSVTSCDLSKIDLSCKAVAVLGSDSRNFYVSRDAVYVWTGNLFTDYDDDYNEDDSILYKMPLDGSAPQAIGTWGGPIDQFSFREEEDGSLHVVTVADSDGERMWRAEMKSGDMALLHLPKNAFGDGSSFAPRRYYRPLPHSNNSWNMQNRYVGRYLLYNDTRPQGQRSDEQGASLAVVNLDGPESWSLPLAHDVTRLDIMGRDGVAIGESAKNGLGFSAIALSPNTPPTVASAYFLPAAQEGENRSHAFFYRPDPKAKDGNSGILGLPVAKRLAPEYARYLGSGSAITYLNRTNRQLSPAGELEARPPKEGINDNCKASCVDWYGNARPIFLGDRLFALMGYELVEGRLDADRRISEVRRVDFTPNKEGRKQ